MFDVNHWRLASFDSLVDVFRLAIVTDRVLEVRTRPEWIAHDGVPSALERGKGREGQKEKTGPLKVDECRTLMRQEQIVCL